MHWNTANTNIVIFWDAVIFKWKLSCMHSNNAASLFGIAGEELEEKLKLEKDKKDADEKYKYKKRKIKELQEKIQVKYK